MINAARRAAAPRFPLIVLPGPVWVDCPRCGSPARIEPPGERWFRADPPARIGCAHCGYNASATPAQRISGASRARIARWRARCDRCGRAAPKDAMLPAVRHGGRLTVSWRCPACGHVSNFPGDIGQGPGIARSGHREPASSTDGRDPWFGLPLTLRGTVAGRPIWAWNAAHLDPLETWLGATLRERSGSRRHWSLTPRLPGWMKTAHARPKVLRALADMRAIALAKGIA